MEKFIYPFEDGHKDMKALLGGKGANLCEMIKIGLPVPSGFVLTTKACLAYYENHEKLPETMVTELKVRLKNLEEETGKNFGSIHNPLLVSVRSGSVVSMPGMMDTVLNLGLNEETVEALASHCGGDFAYDAYRRFIQMFSDVVLGIEKYKFDRIYDRYKNIGENELIELVKAYKKLVLKETHNNFPEDVFSQLTMSVEAVFKSWNNPRAKVYRRIHDISDDLGTAVTVQSMVFGNFNEHSGTGVVFTRNPSTGENKLFGEYLINAQGEDVVAGIRTPLSINTLNELMPVVYEAFIKATHVLEAHYKDMQDIEFTIENRKLYILQTRNGKRTAHAALQIAVDLVHQNVITKEEAILRLDPEQIQQMLHPTFSREAIASNELIAKGLPASPGAACGKIYFDAEKIKEATLRGESTILVRTETSPEDIEGMLHAKGILTTRGGMTSHAAVVARGMGKCCIVGCGEAIINYEEKSLRINDKVLYEGDVIALDGSTGSVYKGEIEAKEVMTTLAFDEVMAWADEIKTLEIRGNADQYKDAKVAIDYGAVGIGLCRTEHMFFSGERMDLMRALILSESSKDRLVILKDLKPFQKSDFYDLFKGLNGLPITVRLLDPPLHEFLPHSYEEKMRLAKRLNLRESFIDDKIKQIQEVNPMLGHRGCRLGITFPEIYEMQMESIFEAICDLEKENIKCSPEIMLPLIGFDKEFTILKEHLDQVAQEILSVNNSKCTYKMGTMIEVPRGALTADEIAKTAEFFSFGTNDLTQMTLGFSRDDSSKFIHAYQEKKIFEKDPFSTIDINGVGKLMKIATELGRKENPKLKIGICGEHGGDPKSIEFCHQIGLDYVSCSPYRVPVAKLAAAQAALKFK